ncbi:MAG: hypothetical protein KatS3mg110_0189 [Pirellulaceae bacterium]|nr:MAG: hypothetical protein KatS3mg110_0189 [Pirellulaceae bacterium]
MWEAVAIGVLIGSLCATVAWWLVWKRRRRVPQVATGVELFGDPPPGYVKTHSDSGSGDANLLDRRVISYRTRSGRSLFTFAMEMVAPGQWRIFILGQPGYGSRADDAHITHRLTDYASGRRYVCWDSPIRTFDEALKIAVAWAEGTEHYIETGQHF